MGREPFSPSPASKDPSLPPMTAEALGRLLPQARSRWHV